jgi:hypothetical protein
VGVKSKVAATLRVARTKRRLKALAPGNDGLVTRSVTATILQFVPALTRIFSTLALLAFLLLALNLALGLATGDYNGAAAQLLEAQRNIQVAGRSPLASTPQTQTARAEMVALADEVRPIVGRARLHMLVGIAAALVNVLVNSITVTYFIGTTRWCREVAETYHLNPDYIQRSNALKRQTFPMALGAIMIILAIVALGGASDPSAGLTDSAKWVLAHYTTALVGVGLIGWSFLTQARNIAENSRLINEIVADVQRIRLEHGLAVE